MTYPSHLASRADAAVATGHDDSDTLDLASRRADLPQITEVRVYLHDGEWCYAADDEDGYDHSDTLDLDGGAGTAIAIAMAAEMFPAAHIRFLPS